MPDPDNRETFERLDRIEEQRKQWARRPSDASADYGRPPVNAPDAPPARGTPGGEFLEQVHRAQRDGGTSRPIVEPQEAAAGPGEDLARQIKQAQDRPGGWQSRRIDR